MQFARSHGGSETAFNSLKAWNETVAPLLCGSDGVERYGVRRESRTRPAGVIKLFSLTAEVF